MQVAHHHQPQAAIFNMGKPTIRWVGNEDGLTADPNFYVADGQYLPPECDVPIRQNWFWQADDPCTLKSVEHLLAIYYRSVGYGANLLLNVPLDHIGLLDPRDCARLQEFSQALRSRFANPIPSTLRQEGATIWVNFFDAVSFDHLVLQEQLKDGQIVDGYHVYAEERLIAQDRTIGHKKIDAFPMARTRQIRIEFSNPDGRLSNVTAFHTGHASLPVVETPETDEKRSERIG